MTFAMWDEKLATGIKEIDDDHKRLFDLVDQFHEAYACGEGNAMLGHVFETLFDYTDSHFRREEDLAAKEAYPRRDHHRQLHETLKAEVIVLFDRFRADDRQGGETDLALELMAFLSNWLHFHITEEDMDLRDFLNSGDSIPN
jgi:hemerythrin-like metal-binding protein